MRVGVTGASGFLGRALVRSLRARGDDVLCFVRPDTAPSDGPVIRWDPTKQLVDAGDLRRAGGLDAVVHLAGAGVANRRWSEVRKLEILSSRTRSTRLLVEALGDADGSPFLASASAIGYYGARGDEPLNESSTPGDDFLARVCVEWEASARLARDVGTKVALMRTGIVMSDQGGALKRQLPLFRLGLGGVLATGRQWLSPIALVDEVRAILWIIDQQLQGPVNLVSPTPLTNRDFTRTLALALHRPARARVPAGLLRVALGGELVDGALLASQRVYPKMLLDSGFSFDCATAASIVEHAIRP